MQAAIAMTNTAKHYAIIPRGTKITPCMDVTRKKNLNYDKHTFILVFRLTLTLIQHKCTSLYSLYEHQDPMIHTHQEATQL